MALKDLPGSTVLDFKILLDNLDAYIKAFALTSAGTKPPGRPVRSPRTGSLITTTSQLIIKAPGGTQLTASMTAIYNTLKGSITVTASDRATLTATSVSTKEGWDNGFFVIRTQLVGANASGADTALIAQLDEFWTRLQAVKGRWNIIGAKGSK